MLEEKLIKLRKKQGYSQQEVADLLSVTRQTISNWECGQATPALDKAAELARLVFEPEQHCFWLYSEQPDHVADF